MRRASPDAAKVLNGTFRPSRARPEPAPALEGDPVAPSWLKGEGLKIWREKIATFAARGQSVRGYEGPLAQYCAVEAEIVEKRKRKVEVKAALLAQHRIYANDFLDTPASQQAAGKTGRRSTRFAGNGRRPTADPA